MMTASTKYIVQLFSGLLLLLLFGELAAALSSQELSKVTISNETGVTLRYLFTSPSDSKVWGPDILGSRSLKFGSVDSYYIHYAGSHARFDLLALDSDNDAYLVEGLLMVEARDTVLQIGRGQYIGPYRSMKISHIYVTNATKHSFSYLFFSPQESKSWGFDILNDTTSLEPGDTISFAIPVGRASTRFEILALSREQAIVQREVVLNVNKPEVYIDFTVSDLH